MRQTKISSFFIFTFFVILSFGFYVQYSAAAGQLRPFLLHQLSVFFIVGAPVFCIAWLQYPDQVFKYGYLFYLFCILLMLIVFFVGKSSMGAKRWIQIAGLNLQPGELVKIGSCIMLAKYFAYTRPSDLKSIAFLARPIFFVFLPIFFALKQPSLGTAALVFFILASVYFAIGVSIKQFLAAGCIFLLSAPILWQYVMHDYQKTRIKTFFYIEKDQKGPAYNILQSKIAIGSGGMLGVGLFSGTQTQLGFLPERQTDFALSVIAEELGFLGVFTFIFFYLALCCVGLVTASRLQNLFEKILIFSVSTSFFLHLAINACMVCGLLPVVGMPIPLVSYGGSAMVAAIVGFAFILKAQFLLNSSVAIRNL